MVIVLCGSVRPVTYQVVNGLDNVKNVSVIYNREDIPQIGLIETFDSNVTGWNLNFLESNGDLIFSQGHLMIQGNFTKSDVNEAVIASKNIFLDLSQFPFFSIRLKAPTNAAYHIRFLGTNVDGETFNVWWEDSPLDDRIGTGNWEEINVDLVSFAMFAVPTQEIVKLTKIEIIIDDLPEFDDLGLVTLKIDDYSFHEKDFVVRDINTLNLEEFNEPYTSLLINFDDIIFPKNWTFQRLFISFNVGAITKTSYTFYLINKTSSDLFVCTGPFFEIQNNFSEEQYELSSLNFVDGSSDLTIYPLYGHITEGLTLAFVSQNLSVSSRFIDLDITSIELIYAVNGLQQNILVDEPTIVTFMSLFFLFSFLPFLSILLIYKLRNIKDFCFTRKNVIVILTFGIFFQLVLSSFTGHSFDMEIWTFHTRSYYESGIVTLNSWPTMPFFYYVLLATYSPYALIRVFNKFDPLLFAHPSRILESVFLKSSLVISGVICFIIIYKISQSVENNKKNSVLLGSLYFLSFLNVFISSVWGMYDGLAVAMLLLGIYYSLVKDRYWIGILLFSLAGFTKIFAFIGFIPLLVKLVKNNQRRLLPFCFLIPIFLGALFYSPLFFSKGFSNTIELLFLRFIKGNTGLGLGSDVSSIIGYQGILGNNLTVTLYPFSLFILEGIVLINYLRASIRNSESNEVMKSIEFIGFSFIVFYLTGLRVYPQHYLWIIPILILYWVYSKKKGIISLVLLISFIVAFLGASSVTSFGYFVFGAPYNVLNVISVSDFQVVGISISFLIIMSFIQLIKPTNENTTFNIELREFLTILIQYLIILSLLYVQYHKILNLSFYLVIFLSIIISILNPSTILYIKNLLKKFKRM